MNIQQQHKNCEVLTQSHQNVFVFEYSSVPVTISVVIIFLILLSSSYYSLHKFYIL